MINEVPEYAASPPKPPAHTTVIVRQASPMPDQHLILAIFVTIFCCLPFGLVAVIKASNVKSRYSAGDEAGAEAASRGAKKWATLALVTGLIVNILVIIAILVYYFLFIKAVTEAFSFDD
ncbi:proline rich transmembrane protein 1B-like [Strongylocentrotus purpuratus]|uniref:Uncharacterized protein n=1 Tax=Strongylocentrotus purpuratus TaxID=7668 RepID=A0A7M7PGB0_STRPU|nr:proline rich transmembrane protein 1B-like [Strongylocentrotus purpuratus]